MPLKGIFLGNSPFSDNPDIFLSPIDLSEMMINLKHVKKYYCLKEVLIMELAVYRPFREMMPSRRFLSHFFGDRFFDPFGEETLTNGGSFSPAVNISETDKDIMVKAEMPGMNEKDINIEVRNGVLTLTGERKKENKVEKDGYYLEESHYGSFHRYFRLPKHVDTEKIKAKLDRGILNITIPKTEKAKPKEIKISTN
jgi:HSP20 family protein